MPTKPEIDINVDDIDVKPISDNENTGGGETLSTEQSDTESSTSVAIDENDITIADKNTPIVMLFGPRSSGKSMTLVRLSRYLRDNGYSIKVDKTFKSDAKYKEKCEKFMKDLETTEALSGNAYTDFLLVKVFKQGATICQFLEAPGEHYFDPKNVSKENFPKYMKEIIKPLKNRKIWAFITEAEWDVNNSVKRSYVRRIQNCKKHFIKPQDRVVILYNKIDQKEELFDDAHLHIKSAEKAMREEYEGIERIFSNSNPITRLWRPYNYRFVPFCTGYYTLTNNRLDYTVSEEMYPKVLWIALLKCIRG